MLKSDLEKLVKLYAEAARKLDLFFRYPGFSGDCVLCGGQSFEGHKELCPMRPLIEARAEHNRLAEKGKVNA